jgi:hypothetical protein
MTIGCDAITLTDPVHSAKCQSISCKMIKKNNHQTVATSKVPLIKKCV